MKPITILLALLAIPSTLLADAAWQRDFDALLRKYVVDGGVHYAAWKASPADLAAIDSVVNRIGADEPSHLGRNDKLAFYIDAYNAWIIDLVLRKYPIRSIKDYAPLYGIFTAKNIRLGGEAMSLNHLEKDLVLAGIGDARAHFGLNCASRSCPVLIPGAYFGSTIDKVLNERARAYMVNPYGVRFSGNKNTASLSMIFKWDADDFTNAAGSVVAFIDKYRQPPLPTGVKLEFQPYDWSLNEAK